MTQTDPRIIPSVDRLLRSDIAEPLLAQYGKTKVTECIRLVLSHIREALVSQESESVIDDNVIIENVRVLLEADQQPSLKPVFNLTGTVLHTNLGRAPLPQVALDAILAIAKGATNLEFDLESGRRGDRHSHVAARLCALTGAEDAVVVNNNAAAVLLVLNTLANRKQVPVSRGELIEIGGAFRMPDIMARAGCKLIEVGTTNRTHRRDFEQAVNQRTALLMKVHTSNYMVQGFTAVVNEQTLANIAHDNGLPLLVDLGSGTLIDLTQHGLPAELTVQQVIAAGADLVTFSGDKLLGGPQAGIIAGNRKLIERIKRNPMMRAMRPDKLILAAIDSVLRLYSDPSQLARRLPALRLLTRDQEQLTQLAKRLCPVIQSILGERFSVTVQPCHSQIGSGAMPVEALPSAAVALQASGAKREQNRQLDQLAAALRRLPQPVIGRIEKNALVLDVRCLEDEDGFTDQLRHLVMP